MGTEGMIRLNRAWWKGTQLTVMRNGQAPETIENPIEGNGYHYEAAEAGRCLRAGKLESDVIPLDKSLAIMRTLDQIRASGACVIPAMKGIRSMRYGKVQGINKPVSRLVQGTLAARETGEEGTFQLLDEVHALGCNVLDTGRIYGDINEMTAGKWVNSRGLRDEIVMIGKGAHHSRERKRVTPEDITDDIPPRSIVSASTTSTCTCCTATIHRCRSARLSRC